MQAAGRDDLPARVAPVPPTTRDRRALLPYHLFRIGEAVVGVLPQRVAYGLAAAAGTVLARCAPAQFDGVRANLRHVLPDVPPRRLERVVRANARHWLRSWVDVLRMRAHPGESLDNLRTPWLEPYDRARAAGGTVLVSIHLGAWEAGLAAWNRKGNPISLLAERLDPPELFERVAGARGALGVHVIPIDAAGIRAGDAATARRLGAQATREVFRVLKGGGCVAMALDRDVTGSGEPVELFGEPVPMPVGIVEIALRTESSIVPVLLIRRGRLADALVLPAVAYDPDADRDTEVRRVVGLLVDAFEHGIRDHPEQWNVMEPLWPADRERIAAERRNRRRSAAQ